MALGYRSHPLIKQGTRQHKAEARQHAAPVTIDLLRQSPPFPGKAEIEKELCSDDATYFSQANCISMLRKNILKDPASTSDLSPVVYFACTLLGDQTISRLYRVAASLADACLDVANSGSGNGLADFIVDITSDKMASSDSGVFDAINSFETILKYSRHTLRELSKLPFNRSLGPLLAVAATALASEVSHLKNIIREAEEASWTPSTELTTHSTFSSSVEALGPVFSLFEAILSDPSCASAVQSYIIAAHMESSSVDQESKRSRVETPSIPTHDIINTMTVALTNTAWMLKHASMSRSHGTCIPAAMTFVMAMQLRLKDVAEMPGASFPAVRELYNLCNLSTSQLLETTASISTISPDSATLLAHCCHVKGVPLTTFGIGSFPGVSRLAVAAGCLKGFSLEQLCQSQGKGAGLSLLKIFVIPEVFEACNATSTPTRIMAFRVLSSLLKTFQKLQSSSPDQFAIIVSKDVLDRCMNTVLANWEHPARQISAQMGDLFGILLEINESSAAGAGSLSSSADWKGLLLNLLAQPSGRKAKYLALSQVIPRVSPEMVFGVDPTVFSMLLTSIGDLVNVSNVASTLVMEVLANLRKWLETLGQVSSGRIGVGGRWLLDKSGLGKEVESVLEKAFGRVDPTRSEAAKKRLLKKNKEKRKKAKEGEEPKALNSCSDSELAALASVLRIWRGIWVPTFASILCSPNRRVRELVLCNVLSDMLEYEPGALSSIIAVLQHRGLGPTEGRKSTDIATPTMASSSEITTAELFSSPAQRQLFGRVASQHETLWDDSMGDDGSCGWERRLWAALQVLQTARKLDLITTEALNYLGQSVVPGEALAAAHVQCALRKDLIPLLQQFKPPSLAQSVNIPRLVPATSLMKGDEESAWPSHHVPHLTDKEDVWDLAFSWDAWQVDREVIREELDATERNRSEAWKAAAAVIAGNGPPQFSVAHLYRALVHPDPDLRIGCLKLLLYSRAVSAAPTGPELRLARMLLSWSMKESQQETQRAIVVSTRRLLSRMRASVVMSRRAIQKQQEAEETKSEPDAIDPAVFQDWYRLCSYAAFHRWIVELCLSSFYPGAPYWRMNLSLELLTSLLADIASESPEDLPASSTLSKSPSGFLQVDPLQNPFHRLCEKDVTDMAVSLLIHTWDKARAEGFKVLNHLPTPLPGYDTEETVNELFAWGLEMASSPRAFESDGGAHILSLIYSNYLRIGWKWDKGRLTYTPDASPDSITSNGHKYIEMLLDIVKTRSTLMAGTFAALVNGASTDENIASMEELPLPHGVALAVRYIVNATSWKPVDDGKAAPSSDRATQTFPVFTSTLPLWRSLLGKIMLTLAKAYVAVLPIVADVAAEEQTDDEYRSKGRVDCRGHLILDDTEAATSTRTADLGTGFSDAAHLDEDMNTKTDRVSSIGPPNTRLPPQADKASTIVQWLVMGAWQLVRDCSLCLSETLWHVPIDDEDVDTAGDHDLDKPVAEALDVIAAGQGPAKVAEAGLLPATTTIAIGRLLLRSLLSLKHLGAISHASAALQVCTRRFLSFKDTHSTLKAAPGRWIEAMLDRMDSARQQFILRRSAGFAQSIVAIIVAEPPSAVPVLLHATAMRLLTFAVRSLKLPLPASWSAPCRSESEDTALWQSHVHGLNTLKYLFQQSSLSRSMERYIPASLCLSVRGFQHPNWAVRNSSMMLFAAVTGRAVGDKSSLDEFSYKNAATASQFFARFPVLQDFLLASLKEACASAITADAAAAEGSDHTTVTVPTSANSVGAAASGGIHPALYPLLLLLSRLRPTFMSDGENSDDVSPFIPLVFACANQRHAMARRMAAKALRSLVPLSSIPHVLHTLVASLPLPPSSGDTSEPTQPAVSLNYIDGLLQQATELLGSLKHAVKSSFGRSATSKDAIAAAVKQVTISRHMNTAMVDSQDITAMETKHMEEQVVAAVTEALENCEMEAVWKGESWQVNSAGKSGGRHRKTAHAEADDAGVSLDKGVEGGAEGGSDLSRETVAVAAAALETQRLVQSLLRQRAWLANGTASAVQNSAVRLLNAWNHLADLAPGLVAAIPGVDSALARATVAEAEARANQTPSLEVVVSGIGEGPLLEAASLTLLKGLFTQFKESNQSPAAIDTFLASLKALLTSNREEIEVWTSQCLKGELKRCGHQFSEGVLIRLRDLCLSLVAEARHPSSKRFMLACACIATANAGPPPASAWTTLHSQFWSTKNVPTRCSIMFLCAPMVAQALTYNSSSSSSSPLPLNAMIEQWMEMLSVAVDNDRAYEMRLAAARALCQSLVLRVIATRGKPGMSSATAPTPAAPSAWVPCPEALEYTLSAPLVGSGLPLAAVPLTAGPDGVEDSDNDPAMVRTLLRGWLLALRLLQDEDDEVRDAARAAVCDVSGCASTLFQATSGMFNSNSFSSPLVLLLGDTSDGPAPVRSSACDTLALPLLFEHVCRFFWWCKPWLRFLLSTLATSLEKGFKGLNKLLVPGASVCSLNRMVFDTETGNEFEEPAILAAIAAFYLKCLPAHLKALEDSDILPWLTKQLEALKLTTQEFEKKCEEAGKATPLHGLRGLYRDGEVHLAVEAAKSVKAIAEQL